MVEAYKAEPVVDAIERAARMGRGKARMGRHWIERTCATGHAKAAWRAHRLAVGETALMGLRSGIDHQNEAIHRPRASITCADSCGKGGRA